MGSPAAGCFTRGAPRVGNAPPRTAAPWSGGERIRGRKGEVGVWGRSGKPGGAGFLLFPQERRATARRSSRGLLPASGTHLALLGAIAEPLFEPLGIGRQPRNPLRIG